MDAINIGAVIARCRKKRGITQDEVAQHLGVSKAAVSKWEMGQSLPDVAQLPRIASYFSLTLDELFSYHPQLSRDQIAQVGYGLFGAFEQDFEVGYQKCLNSVRDYASCWPLLLQVVMVLINRAAVDETHQQILLEKSLELLARVEENADEKEYREQASLLRATSFIMLENFDDAIVVLSGMRSPSSPIDAMLANAYEQAGNHEAALKTYQESVFWGITEVMNGCSAQILLCSDDKARVNALVVAAEAMVDAFDLDVLNPVQGLGLQINAATAYKQMGNEECALNHLEHYVAYATDERILKSDPTMGKRGLFDKLDAVLSPKLSSSDEQLYEVSVGEMLQKDMKDRVFSSAVWQECTDKARFRKITSPLEAL